MTDKELFKLALFALDIVKINYTQSRHINEAITALKARLAQPEQEPVDYEKLAALGWQAMECTMCGGGAMGYPQRTEQEFVIDRSAAIRIATALGWEPKREWVVLTAEEVLQCWEKAHEPGNREHINAIRMADEVEAKLKEKNT
jgi:hypothetical protein